MTLFDRLMRVMPMIMTGFALFYYVLTVVITLWAGHKYANDLGMETLPSSEKFNLILVVFIKPLTSVLALLFGAALLWRLDKFAQVKGSAE